MSYQMRTIEDSFDYNVEQILKQAYQEYAEESTSKSFEDWLWDNRVIVGEFFLERINEYSGIEEAINNIVL